MSYLLWQIFWCLLGTALLFLAFGWLLKGRFGERPDTGNLATESERISWQTSVTSLKSRLEAETDRTLAAERALEDSRGQAAHFSALLDRHSAEIRTLAEELTDKDKVLDQRATIEKQLQIRIAELESRQIGMQKLATESAALEAKIGVLTSQTSGLHKQLAERNTAIKSSDDEKNALTTQLAAATNELAAAVAARAESLSLHARIADLEPKLKTAIDESLQLKSQTGYLTSKLSDLQTTGHLEREAAIDDLEGENQELKEQMLALQVQVSRLPAADAELDQLRNRIADLELKLHDASEENGKLKAQVSELTPKLALAAAAGVEAAALRAHVDELEPQVQDWETRYAATVAQKDAELPQCHSLVADLDARLLKQNAEPAAQHHAPPPDVPTKADRDDLKKIYGIGPVLEKRLNGLGVFFFRDIAMWTKEDVLHFEVHLKEFRKRIERDSWVEGAREEHLKKYGERLFNARSAEV